MRRLLLVLALLAACPVTWCMDADLERVRTRLVELLSSPSGDPAAVARAAARLCAQQQADGTWPDIDYQSQRRSGWPTAQHVTRNLWELALHLHLARAAGGADDPATVAALHRGLDAWFRLDLRNSNWWQNEIGIPTGLGNVQLLAGDAIDPGRRAQACAIMRRSDFTRWTGQNLVWGVNVLIMRGCIEGDGQAVADGFARFFQEVRVGVPPQEGILPDWSFFQHGNVLYAGGYGQGFTCDGARLVACAAGTRFQAPAAVTDVLLGYLLDGQRWMLRGGAWDFGVVGREVSRPAKSPRDLGAAARTLGTLGLPRSADCTAMGAAIAARAGDSGIAGNRHFWCSDYMAHHRPGFFASARMHSVRVDNTDSLTNDENRRSHFIADGAMCLMRDGDEYEGIFAVWDWQRVPGITCEQRPQMPAAGLVRRTGTSAFVGGVSDGGIGLAAMALARDSLVARKAWLFLDEGVVCLGAGISSGSGLPVLTSIEQRLLDGPAERGGDAWVWHDRVGYALLAPAGLALSAGPQRGRWSDIGVGSTQEIERPVFSLAIDHGRDPQGATYAYAVLPGMELPALRAWSAAPAVTVLRNDASIQAVAQPAAGVLAAVFHQPGQVEGWTSLAVDQPCLVLLRRAGDAVILAIADPEQRPLTVQVELGSAVSGEGVERHAGGTRLRIGLPGGPQAGSSVVRRLVLRP